MLLIGFDLLFSFTIPMDGGSLQLGMNVIGFLLLSPSFTYGFFC